jgi:CRISPR-associated protein Cmr1
MISRALPFPAGLKLESSSGENQGSLVYHFRTITPVFGAGVRSRELDKTTPLRGTTVRGHLRFWWRVSCGRRFGSLSDLREAEDILWGSSSVPSKVTICLSDVVSKPVMAGNGAGFRDHYPPYALFPFQPTDEEPSYAEAWETLKFTLSISASPNLHSEIHAALWAWANFGGIGSRTRRGCGALFCPSLAPIGPPPDNWLSEGLAAYPISTPIPGRPLLLDEPLFKQYHPPDQFPSPMSAWEVAIRVLAEFRQLPPLARKGANQQFGRSHWPEADSLRAQSDRGVLEHLTSETLPSPLDSPAFPRAELGLPYQIKFKDNSDRANDCTVEPAGSSRMASPIICRPMAIGPTGNRAIPMILLLSSPGPQGIKIVRKKLPVVFKIAPVIKSPALSIYPNSPMLGRSIQGSALEAFMAYARESFS